MSGYLYILFWIVSFGASIAGAICGIGGGVIIKPTLDAFGVLSVSTISFLSGCTVLAMTCYSVIKGKMSGESLIDMKTGTPLAIGAAIGGVVGKSMFQALSNMFANKDMVGAVQAGCLLIITLGTLIYTLKKDKIKTLHVTNAVVCIIIGVVLGIFSSFLGIGGGPINLVVLFYFFSMETKTLPVHHPLLPDHEPDQFPGHQNSTGIYDMAFSPHGHRRHPGRHERPQHQ